MVATDEWKGDYANCPECGPKPKGVHRPECSQTPGWDLKGRSMNILQEADTLINGPRQESYGHPAESFGRIAKIWSAILRTDVTPEEVGLCMIGVKISREVNAHSHDNLADIAGYAQLIELIHDYGAKEDSCESSEST